jgi:hypothetical protein
LLIVLRRTEAQLDLRAPRERVVRKEVAPLVRGAIRSKGVNLPRCVEAPQEAVAVPSIGIAANDDHISVKGRPLALDTHEPTVEVEDHVVSPTFTSRPIDVDPELRCVVHDGLLGDVSFLVGREHVTDASRRIG